jgi:tetraspanin-13/31
LLKAFHLFQIVGVSLVATSIYGNRFTDLPIIPGIIACGIVLILLSICGIFGAWKHHQVILFFYLIILFCLFIVQFAIACSCLAVSKNQQKAFAEDAWNEISDDSKAEIQTTFTCCGLNSTVALDHPSCDTVNKICCPLGSANDCSCSPCLPKLEDTIDSAFRVSGSIGLIFSFTEVNTDFDIFLLTS